MTVWLDPSKISWSMRAGGVSMIVTNCHQEIVRLIRNRVKSQIVQFICMRHIPCFLQHTKTSRLIRKGSGYVRVQYDVGSTYTKQPAPRLLDSTSGDNTSSDNTSSTIHLVILHLTTLLLDVQVRQYICGFDDANVYTMP